ncbi:MAG: hypothetical protein HYU36_09665 [Planctomycetes bacterium]|nr:hypothetical protein [Planctomycetota bacterium]
MESPRLSSRERVMCALNFREPDRIPRFFSFWPEFVQTWQKTKGTGSHLDVARSYGSDMMIVAANETAWPSSAKTVEQAGDQIIHRTGWGELKRTRSGAMFSQTLQTALPKRVDPDRLEFEDPLLESRYEGAAAQAAAHQDEFAVFGKTGGPYLRAAFLRGQEDFLADIAEDPAWVKAFVDRVTDHILQVGQESIRRFQLQATGIGIYDDACSFSSPIMGPAAYEKLFFPALCKLVRGYKQAGAAKVFHHCDGNVGDLLDLWAAAGIDAVHPLEFRTGLDPVRVREKYPGRLAVIGSLDNSNILPRGDQATIRRHLARILEAARGGGFILAPHSIGPDISLDTMQYLIELLDQHANYPLRPISIDSPDVRCQTLVPGCSRL